MNDPADVYAGMIAALRVEFDLSILLRSPPRLNSLGFMSIASVKAMFAYPSHQTIDRLQRLHARLAAAPKVGVVTRKV